MIASFVCVGVVVQLSHLVKSLQVQPQHLKFTMSKMGNIVSDTDPNTVTILHRRGPAQKTLKTAAEIMLQILGKMERALGVKLRGKDMGQPLAVRKKK
uniref:Uncharacterized protein n=1 Tax=Parascaris univalens TaxID=6257 RepID=A0A915B6C3_PARUN